MSSSNKIKELTVLCPNGKRVIIKTNPSTSIGQIIEEACLKHGFDPYIYNLKFLHRTLDPSSTLHYSNIPNHAQLELIKALERREEGFVIVNLVTDRGQRLIAEFPASTLLWNILTYHENQPESNFCIPTASSGCQPFIVYTMRRIIGEELKTCTLKSLGLFSGKCMMRYNVQKIEANQSSPILIVRPKITHKASKILPDTSETWDFQSEVSHVESSEDSKTQEEAVSEPKDSAIIEEMEYDSVLQKDASLSVSDELSASRQLQTQIQSLIMEGIENQGDLVKEGLHENKSYSENSEPSSYSQQCLVGEKLVPKIIQLSDHNFVLFSLDDAPRNVPIHESDDFFELTLSEVRSLHREQVKQKEIVEAPLMTLNMRQLEKDSRLLSAMNRHPVTQLRICFPDRHVIQANFKPHNTIREVMEFLKPSLIKSDLKFYLYTTFPRRVLEPELSLVEAGCIPKARLYIGAEEGEVSFLSRETLAKKSSFEAAENALIKTNPRRTSSNDCEGFPSSSHEVPRQTSHPVERSSGAISRVTPTANQGVPKWFKLGK